MTDRLSYQLIDEENNRANSLSLENVEFDRVPLDFKCLQRQKIMIRLHRLPFKFCSESMIAYPFIYNPKLLLQMVYPTILIELQKDAEKKKFREKKPTKLKTLSETIEHTTSHN